MSDVENRLPAYPERDDRSGAYHVARTAMDAAAAATLIPGAGYAIGQIVEAFVSAPLQKRRDEWFNRVGEGLRDLQDRVGDFDPSRLSENDDFISAVFEATQAAMKTGKETKLEALRNGVLNIAAGLTLDDVLRGSFFSYVERFSTSHVEVLKVLANPEAIEEVRAASQSMSMGAQIHVLEAAPIFKQVEPSARERIMADLAREGLADVGSLNVMGTTGVFFGEAVDGDR